MLPKKSASMLVAARRRAPITLQSYHGGPGRGTLQGMLLFGAFLVTSWWIGRKFLPPDDVYPGPAARPGTVVPRPSAARRAG